MKEVFLIKEKPIDGCYPFIDCSICKSVNLGYCPLVKMKEEELAFTFYPNVVTED